MGPLSGLRTAVDPASYSGLKIAVDPSPPPQFWTRIVVGPLSGLKIAVDPPNSGQEQSWAPFRG